MAGLSDFLLTKLEHTINLAPEPDLAYLDRIRRIRNKVDKILGQAPEQEPTAYQKHLAADQKAILKNFYRHLERVVNFVAVYDGYLQPDMDANRTVELLRRLEKEVFGQYILLHPRKAHVHVSDPIDLRAHFEAFLQDKRATVERLTGDIERRIYAGLQPDGIGGAVPLPVGAGTGTNQETA